METNPAFVRMPVLLKRQRRIVFVFFLRRIWGGTFRDYGNEADRGREGSMFGKAAEGHKC